MTRFNMFTDDELNVMESVFCNEGLKYLVDEIHRERRYREINKRIFYKWKEIMKMEEKKNFVTAEGTFKYYDEVPTLIVEGKNFEKTFHNDEARELFKILIGAVNK